MEARISTGVLNSLGPNHSNLPNEPYLPHLAIFYEMKLIRFGDAGKEKLGLVGPGGEWLDASEFGEDISGDFLASDGPQRLSSWSSGRDLPVVDPKARLGPPISACSKIICIGLNYAKHAQESGMAVPSEPIIFYKSTTAICGPYDQIIIPRDSTKTDWEVELAVVIGQRASYVEEADAMKYVAGYLVHNDVSERAFQLEMGGQWLKGKSSDTFAPLGPWLVTRDEIADPHALDLWLKVNGETVQSSDTSDLIFKIPYLISYVSRFMTLLPGDIISTGTPSGVGMGFNPSKYLQPGDVVELGIDGLGISRQEVVAYQ